MLYLSTSHLATAVWLDLLPQDPVLPQSDCMWYCLDLSNPDSPSVELTAIGKQQQKALLKNRFLFASSKEYSWLAAAPKRATPGKCIPVSDKSDITVWGAVPLLSSLVWELMELVCHALCSVLGWFTDSTHPITPRNNIINVRL